MNPTIPLSTPAQQEAKGFLAGYASFFDVTDHQGDRVAHGAFTKTLNTWKLLEKKPKMLWQHNPKEPIGLWTALRQDEKGLYVEGRLALGIPRADEAYILLKEGVLDGLSIGFRTVKSAYDPERKARILLDIDLLEISLVTFGANSKAVIQQVKGGQ